MVIKSTIFNSKIGCLHIVSEDDFLIQIKINPAQDIISQESKFNNRVIIQLKEYFLGNLTLFSVPIKFLEKSDFKKKIWNEMLKIPYGGISSYKSISENIGHPKAYRAVGTAIGQNPIPIIIPCHRVLNSNGGIGGFSAGLDIKKKLLKIEQMDGLKKNC